MKKTGKRDLKEFSVRMSCICLHPVMDVNNSVSMAPTVQAGTFTSSGTRTHVLFLPANIFNPLLLHAA